MLLDKFDPEDLYKVVHFLISNKIFVHLKVFGDYDYMKECLETDWDQLSFNHLDKCKDKPNLKNPKIEFIFLNSN